MRLNRKWILVIALVVSMATAISGTLAYLTATDTETNTFTVGNVSIDLEEPNYPGNDKPLLPGVTIPKDPQIKNDGTTDAWVWLKVTLDRDLYDMEDSIDWNTTEWIKSVETGEPNYVVIMKYKEKLAAGATTTVPAFTRVSIPTTVKDMSSIVDANGKVNIVVNAYAIQDAEAFNDVEEAYKAYDGDSIEITEVATLDEFKAALKKSGIVKLTKDITLDNTVQLENGVDVKLDLSGKTITFEPGDSYNSKDHFPMFLPNAGTKLTITGNGTVDLGDNFVATMFGPRGELVIENGNFIADRAPDGTVPEGLFIGVASNDSKVVIKGGYFDSGYYDDNAEKPFSETADDVTNRGKNTDKNLYRTAIKQNISKMINLSKGNKGTEDFKIYGGTFVGANPLWGDEGCAMPITPDYLRPYSYYQGTFLEGQQVYDDKLETPAGYTITEGTTTDGRPTYTVSYSK